MNHSIANVFIYLYRKMTAEQGSNMKSLISQLSGVQNAQVSQHASRMVYVEYDPSVISAQQIRDSLEKSGHQASLVGM